MAGTLYLCATPIGNLEDMTYRVVRVLKEADVIAAEDTRNSIRLLNHFDIHTPMTSYHEFNRVEKAHVLIDRLLSGENVALITDAGMPGISDPGEDLVRMCMEAGICVTVLPGACAAVTALAASGQSTRRFCFEGFLPAEKKERRQVLKWLREETRTIILYEAPHRLQQTLEELRESLGNRPLSICRELTKVHETITQTTIDEAICECAQTPPRGEYVLVVRGRDKEELTEEERASWQELTVAEHVQLYEAQGMDRREAMKAAARDRGIGKREIYQALLHENQ